MGRSKVNFPVPAGFRMDPKTKKMEPKYTVGITICPSDFGVPDDADNMTMAMAIQGALQAQSAAAATARAEAAEQRAEALAAEGVRLRAVIADEAAELPVWPDGAYQTPMERDVSAVRAALLAAVAKAQPAEVANA